MYIVSNKSGLSKLRKQLEHCYDKGLNEEAILIGDILDKMQYLLFKKKLEKDANRQSNFRLSFELIRA